MAGQVYVQFYKLLKGLTLFSTYIRFFITLWAHPREYRLFAGAATVIGNLFVFKLMVNIGLGRL